MARGNSAGSAAKGARAANICRRCHKPPPDGARVSGLGYCATCGPARAIELIIGMKAKAGPDYERFRANNGLDKYNRDRRVVPKPQRK